MLVRAACIMVPQNNGPKAPIWLSGKETSCLPFARSGTFGLDILPKRNFSLIQPSFHSGIRLVPGNVVMHAIGMYV